MSAKMNVPKLRFGEFSGEWEEATLGNLIQIKSGISPSSYILSQEGKYPFLKVEDLNNCEKYQYLSREYSNSQKNLISKNSVIFPKRGAAILLNKVRINKSEVLMDSNLMAIMPNESKLDNEYLFYKILKDKLYKIADTSTIPQINNKHILPYRLWLPSKPEQEKIASFLSSVDSKIEQLSKKKTLLEQYKKGVMQKIFSQELRFKDDDGSEFPEWVEKKLGEVTFNVSKKNKNNLSYPIYSINNKVGFIPQGEQFEGMDSKQRNYDISLYKIIEKKTFAYNPARIDVGSLGYSGDLNNIIISSLYVCFKTKDTVNDNFLSHYFKTFWFNKSVLRNTEGGVRNYLFYNNFANIKTLLPSLKEQTKIASFLSSLDKKIELTNKELNATKEFKKALLQKMFV